MNLNELFKIQEKLDDWIREGYNLQGVDLLDKKILALQVELGELANEWRGFKFWSVDQEPRTEVICRACKGEGEFISGLRTLKQEACRFCDGTGIESNPLLEEYVDCLHFILSIGLELRISEVEIRKISRTDIVFVFNELFEIASKLRSSNIRTSEYEWLVSEFVKLGEMLGFTWEQIAQAYLKKNKINHTRQSEGY